MFRVAVVGRPNVGKSSLFNRITQTRRSIVGDQPGITRDRIIEVAEWSGRQFEVIDTGGIVPDERSLIPEQILAQASMALEDSQLVLFVVDVRAGITPLDQSLNAMLRQSGKEYFIVANKADVPRFEQEALIFHNMGIDQVFPVSAEHNQGIADLLDRVVERVPEQEEAVPTEETRIAIIGRPNVGKSSLLNRFVGKTRVIVTDIPGTTRDAVDTVLKVQGRTYRLIDTAGIRRKGKTDQMAEKMSVVMARKSMVRADVALLIIDAEQGASKLDATIGGYAHDVGCSVIVVVNKWDLIEKDTQTAIRMERQIRDRMRFLDYAPFIFVSALSGRRIVKIIEHVDEAYRARYLRISTGELNQFLQRTIRPHMLQTGSSSKSPVLYATQTGVAPPTFVLFVRGAKALHFSTIRFLTNQLRQDYEFYGTPIRILQRNKSAR